MATQQRPLSPHLQIYRPQLTSVLSISHRITGVLLSAGIVPVVVWLVALSQGAEAYAGVMALFSHPVAIVFWVAWSFALFYHFCNGIRHLLWDAGLFLDLRGAYITGWTVVALAGVLTALAWGVWS